MIILNLKNYPESTTSNLNKLLDAAVEAVELNPEIENILMIAPSIFDLRYAKDNYKQLNIIAPHVDNKSLGNTTGWIPFELIQNYGIRYSIINHSEHRIDFSTLNETISQIQSAGIRLIVCCESAEEAEKILEAKPYAIAYEPKELIGSGVSVTTRPEEVTKFVDVVKGKTIALIGAGVSTMEDVSKAIGLGADGALLASAFVKAENPKEKILELTKPIIQKKV